MNSEDEPEESKSRISVTCCSSPAVVSSQESPAANSFSWKAGLSGSCCRGSVLWSESGPSVGAEEETAGSVDRLQVQSGDFKSHSHRKWRLHSKSSESQTLNKVMSGAPVVPTSSARTLEKCAVG